MLKTEWVSFRASPSHKRRLVELSQATGLQQSEVLRRLLEKSAIVTIGALPMDVKNSADRDLQPA